MRKIIVLLLLLILIAPSMLLLLPATVEAKTIVVPDDYSTIQEAIENASNGDTISVKGGRYFGNIIVDKSVQILGDSPSTTTVYGVYEDQDENAFQINADNVVIANLNVVNDNSYAYGIGVSPSGCHVRNNALTGRGKAIRAEDCSDVNIIGNTFSGVDSCIWLNKVYGGTISENIIPNEYSYIIVATHSSDVVISNNDMSGSSGEYVIRESSTFLVQNNTLGSGSITLLQSPHCSFLDNTAQNPNDRFIIEESPATQFKRNSFSSAFGVFGYTLADFTNDIDISNTINAKPIYYLMSQNNLEINPETYPNIGYLAIVNSRNVKVSKLSLSNNLHGILLAFTTNSEIAENNLSGNDNGILLACDSNWNSISMNTLDKNGVGIRVYDSSDNNIFRNEINQSSNAIWLELALNNRIVGNNILNDGEVLHIVNAKGNTIYHNNFINYRFTTSYSPGTGNIWTDGYFGGGNYWGYSGIDEKSGPSQG